MIFACVFSATRQDSLVQALVLKSGVFWRHFARFIILSQYNKVCQLFFAMSQRLLVYKSWFDLYCFSFSLTSLFQSKNEVSLNTTKFIENSVRINYSSCVRNRQIGYLKVSTFYTLAAVHAPYLLGQAKMTFYHLTCDIPRLNIE